jgi:hypothetical protein
LFNLDRRLATLTDRIARKVHVPAVGYASAPFDAVRARLANELGRRVLEDSCGHDATVDTPERVAERARWITMDRFAAKRWCWHCAPVKSLELREAICNSSKNLPAAPRC